MFFTHKSWLSLTSDSRYICIWREWVTNNNHSNIIVKYRTRCQCQGLNAQFQKSFVKTKLGDWPYEVSHLKKFSHWQPFYTEILSHQDCLFSSTIHFHRQQSHPLLHSSCHGTVEKWRYSQLENSVLSDKQPWEIWLKKKNYMIKKKTFKKKKIN